MGKEESLEISLPSWDVNVPGACVSQSLPENFGDQR